MAAEFIMPKLGLTMESGTIGTWLVADGTAVVAGEAIASIETDKVVTDIESSATGVLRYVGTPGKSYDCGELIGWICEPGEEPPALAEGVVSQPISALTATVDVHGVGSGSLDGPAARDGSRLFASPHARKIAASLGVALAAVKGTGPNGRIVSEDVERAHASGVGAPTQQRLGATRGSQVTQPNTWGTLEGATFAAVQLARMVGLDIAEVPTAEPDGIVTRDDVAEYVRALISRARSGSPQPADNQALRPPALAGTGFTPMRRVIAQRMSESIHTMAQLTLTIDVDMDVVVADRQRRKVSNTAAPGFTDYVVMASAIALERHPYVNTSLTDVGLVGMAVAVDGGLMVPVVRSPHKLNLDQLSVETTKLATAARTGRLALHEMEGGTFSVTALGMFGVDVFTPIINPPNSAILGVGRIRTDTAWTEGVPSPVSRMTLSLTWDHRVFDGAPAAEFGREVKSILEDGAVWAAA
jgi:pyruvate dehydrogenase E2 component (dihydrolipoamide acetyltransferase)